MSNLKGKIKLRKKILTDIKNIKKDIKSDLSEAPDIKERRAIKRTSYKKYDEIYKKYGKKAYAEYVPKRIRKADEKQLVSDYRYFELYEKHGEMVFNKHRANILAEDIGYETNNKIMGFYKGCTTYLKDITKRGVAVITGFFIGSNVLLIGNYEQEKKENYKRNMQEITEYLDSVQEYSEEVKLLNLTDIEVIMKVMDDMWKNIDGYGEPKKDLTGYMGLDMSDSNGIGVCRNMADDCARKFNQINSNYNARVVGVDLEVNIGEYNLANIEQVIIDSEEEIIINEYNTMEKVLLGSISIVADKLFANHAVVLMDIPDDNVTLIIDPTNPSIGIYKNGKIKVLNSKTDKGISLIRKPLSETFMCGLEALDFPKQYIDSFLENDLSAEELEAKFGVEAQNKALQKVRNIKEKTLIEELQEYYSKENYNFKTGIEEKFEILDIDKMEKVEKMEDNER